MRVWDGLRPREDQRNGVQLGSQRHYLWSQSNESSYKMSAGKWIGGTCSAQSQHTGSVQLGSAMDLCCIP